MKLERRWTIQGKEIIQYGKDGESVPTEMGFLFGGDHLMVDWPNDCIVIGAEYRFDKWEIANCTTQELILKDAAETKRCRKKLEKIVEQMLDYEKRLENEAR